MINLKGIIIMKPVFLVPWLFKLCTLHRTYAVGTITQVPNQGVDANRKGPGNICGFYRGVALRLKKRRIGKKVIKRRFVFTTDGKVIVVYLIE